MWAYVGVALAAGVIGATVQGWRMGEDIAELKAQYAYEAQEATQRALRQTSIYKEQSDAAVRKAEARTAQNKRDADGLRNELDGLRGDLASVPDRIRSASRDAVDQYAATASVVFDQCVRRYSEMAGAAQGHASDVETLRDAWPSKPR